MSLSSDISRNTCKFIFLLFCDRKIYEILLFLEVQSSLSKRKVKLFQSTTISFIRHPIITTIRTPFKCMEDNDGRSVLRSNKLAWNSPLIIQSMVTSSHEHPLAVRFTLNSACSASFLNRNSVFLS